MTEKQNSPATLVAVVEGRLKSRETGSVHGAGLISAVRAAITPSGDVLAAGETSRYTAGLTQSQARGARRAAAIRAIHKDVPQQEVPDGERSGRRSLPVGEALALIYRQESHHWPSSAPATDQFIQQVAALPLLDVDEAALVLLGLIGRSKGTPVDFRSLAWTLAGWGKGIDEASANMRNTVVLDFYTNTDRADASAGTGGSA